MGSQIFRKNQTCLVFYFKAKDSQPRVCGGYFSIPYIWPYLNQSIRLD